MNNKEPGTYSITGLARQFGIYGMAKITGAVLFAILLPLHARVLSREQMGVMSLINAVKSVIGPLLTLGAGAALFRYRFDPAGLKDPKTLNTTAAVLMIMPTFLLTICVFPFCGTLSQLGFGTRDYSSTIAMVLVLNLFDTILILPLTLMRIEGKAPLFAIISVGRLFAAIVLNLILLLIAGMGLAGIYIGLASASILSVLACLPFITSRLATRTDTLMASKLLDLGTAYVLSAVFLWILRFIDQFFLKAYFGTETVGIYSVAFKFASLIQLITVSFQLGWPRFVLGNHEKPDARRTFAHVTTWWVMGLSYIVLGLSALAPEIIRIAATNRYLAAAAVVPLLCTAAMASGLFEMFNIGITITKRVGLTTAILAGAAIINIILNRLLIPGMGMRGAAWATAATYGFAAAISLAVNRRLYHVPYEGRRLFFIGVMATAGLAATWVARSMGGAASLLLRATVLVLFPVLLWTAGLLNLRERQWIRSMFTGIMSR